VTKILAVGEPPIPTEVRAAGAGRVRGRADVTISHPRFLEFVAPGVFQGTGDPLARLGGCGSRWGRRSPSAISGTISRCGEVGHGDGHAERPRRGTRRREVRRTPARRGRGGAVMIEDLVLASPADVLANAARLVADAHEVRR
jgi:hypothetical protein